MSKSAIVVGAVLALGGCELVAGVRDVGPYPDATGTSVSSTTTSSTTTTTTTTTASCTDGVQDGEETDVDCGGPMCDAEGKLCAFGKMCKSDADCATCFCNGVTCDALTLGTAQKAVGVAVDATSVYWTDMGAGIVAKAPAAGGGPSLTLAFNQSSPNAIALDAKNVYFATPSAVMSVPIDGGAPNTIASEQNGIVAIAVDLTSVYWSWHAGTGSNVLSTPIGGGQETFLASGPWFVSGIAVDATNVYWTEDKGIMKTPIVPGAASTIAAVDGATAIVVSGPNVYWTEAYPTNAAGTMGEATIATAPTDGDGGAPAILASYASNGDGYPLGIAVDGSSVYWTDSNELTVMKAPIGGGGPVTTIASGQNGPAGIAIDATYVYWADGTAVKKACK